MLLSSVVAVLRRHMSLASCALEAIEAEDLRECLLEWMERVRTPGSQESDKLNGSIGCD